MSRPMSRCISRRPLAALFVASAVSLSGALAACGSDGEGSTTSTTEARTTTTAARTSTTDARTTTTAARTTTTVARPSSTTTVTVAPPTTAAPPTTKSPPRPEPRPGAERFCTAYEQIDTLGAGMSEDDVADFKAAFGRFRAGFEDLLAVAPDDVRADLTVLTDWLHDVQPQVHAARTMKDVAAIGESGSDDRLESAFDRVEHRAGALCGSGGAGAVED